MPTDPLLQPSALLDFEHPRLQALIAARGWHALPAAERARAAYEFVRGLPFGYNARDATPASQVLADGHGQCNTKSSLLMALLRALGLRCRLHGFRIDKALQRGAVPAWAYPLTPARILHSWVELELDGRWLELEGVILDPAYLQALQGRFPQARRFCGYGAATPDLQRPGVEWSGGSTHIQREGIVEDLGLYPDPDRLLAAQGDTLSPLRQWLFERLVRARMNAGVARLRGRAV